MEIVVNSVYHHFYFTRNVGVIAKKFEKDKIVADVRAKRKDHPIYHHGLVCSYTLYCFE